MKMQTYALALSLIMAVSVVPAFAQITEPLDNYDFVDFYQLISQNIPEDVTFDDDGDRMFVFNAGNSRIFEFSLSAAYDLSGARFARSIDLPRAQGSPGAVDSSVMDIDFSNNGMWFFLLGNDHETVYMYRLASPFTLSSTGYTYLGELDLTVQPTQGETPEFEFDPRGMTFSPDGSLLVVVGIPGFDDFNYRVYSLNTSFDIRTANSNNFVSSRGPTDTLHDVGISSGMSNLFIIRDSSIINQYNSDGGFDGPLVIDTLDLSSLDSMFSGIEFSDTGKKMFLTGLENKRVYEFVQNTQLPSFEPKLSLTLPEGTNLGDESGLKFTATDPDESPVTYRLTGAPSWMSIDTNTGQLEGVIPYNVVLCSDDTRIQFQVSASDDGFTGNEPDNAVLNYELVVTSSPDPANSETRNTVNSLILDPSQSIIDLKQYTVDNDDDDLTYHDARISSGGLVSIESFSENGILSITQNSRNQLSVLEYRVCNGVDYIPLVLTLQGVDNTPGLPEFLSVPDGVTIPEGTIISSERIDFSASDANLDTLSFRLDGAPDWLGIETPSDLTDNVGRLSGTIQGSAPGQTPVVVQGTIPYDAVGCEGGSRSFTFGVQVSDDGFVDPANTISVQYTLTVTSKNRPDNNDPVISTVLLYKGASTIDLGTFSSDEDGDALTYSNPLTDFLKNVTLLPNGTMSVNVPHNPGSTGSMDITICDGTNIVTRTAALRVPVYEFVDSYNAANIIEDIRGIYFSNDGRHLFHVYNTNRIYESFFAFPAFDLSANEIFLASPLLVDNPRAIDVVFNNDGSNMFIIESDGSISRYPLSNKFMAFPIGTPVSFDISPFFADNPDTQPLTIRGLDFSANGDKMYVVTSRGTSLTDTIYEFTLDTNFAISSISSTQFRNISEHVEFAQGIRISDDDGKLFIVDSSGDSQRDDTIVEYTFGSNLDLSTIDFSGAYTVADQGDEPAGVVFSPNGYKMFVADADNDRINEYNIGVPFTMLSAPDIMLPVEERFGGTFRGLSMPVQINFTRPLTGFTADDITLVGSVNGSDPEVSNFTGSGASYSFNVERGASDGTIDITIDRRVATDEFGHPNEASRLASTFIDGQPVPVINSTVTSPTNLLSISYMVEFSDSVTNFNDTGIEVSGSANGVVENFVEIDDDSYTFDVSHNSVDGVVSVFIPAGVADEIQSTNKNLASNRLNHTIDRIAPIPTLTSTSPEDTNSRTIPFKVTFEEPVTGFNHTGITVTGLADVDEDSFEAESDSVYNFDIVATADGQVSVQIPADVAQDAAENDNVASGEVARTVDTDRARAALSTEIISPTKLAVIPYTVDFGEQVNGFVAADIDASIDDNDLTATNPVSDDGIIYTFNIAHGVNEGELTVSIPENVTTDNAGNNNTASESLAITIDRIAPTVTSASVISPGIIRLDVSETVFDRSATAADFTINGVASTPTVTSIAVSGSTITLTLSSLITDADDPVVSYTRNAGSIEDLATNPLADFANQIATNDLDTTRPVPTLTITSEPGAVTHTNSTTVSYMVTFDMDVTGFDEDDIEVEGSANNGNPEASNFVTVDGDEYTFDVERGDSDGNVIVFIPADMAIDGSGNQNVASDRLEITFDTISPTLTLASTESGDTRLRTIPVNATFSERVDDFGADDIIIVGSATAGAPTTDDNILYMFDVIVTADGDVTVSIREDAARDAAGNRNAESESVAFAVDTERPSVEIASSTVTDLPTNLESISYTVTFRESINGFTAADITASIVGSTPTVTGPVLTIGNTQTYVVAHNSNEGILTVSIPENVATDNAGNNNTASNILVHTIDRIAPTVDGASVSDTDTIILDISELLSESGGVASDFAISGVATNPSVASIDITGSTITLNLDDSITDADLPLVSYTGTAGSIEDLAENPLAAFTNRAVENEIDTTGPVPTLTITSEPGAVTHTNSTTVSYMVTFDMDVTGFDEDDIEVEGSANNGNPEASNFVTVDGDEYTFDVERGDSDGNVMVFIPADRAIDGSGNQNVASNRLEITFDTAPPTLTLASTESGDTRLRIIPVNATFSERVDDFDINDIIIVGSATANTPTTDDNILYMFDVIATADGDVTVSIREDAARDVTGNRNAESESVAFAVDTERPSVEIASSTVTDLPTNLESISYTVTFRESINGFTAADITASIDGSTPTVTGPVLTIGDTQTYVVAHNSNEGMLTVSIPENVATDNAGNNNTASNILVHTIDRIAPTVIAASVLDTSTITLEISEPVSGGVPSDFTISGVATNPSVASIVITGSTITLNLNSLITDADNPVISYTGTAGSIEDPATNPLTAFTDRAVDNEIDTTRPAITSFGTESPDPTNSQTITYTVQFSETVTGFDATGIDVSGTSGGTAAEPTGSGTDYTFTVTRGISDGTVTVTILEGAARDADDNLSFASSPVEITVDATPPTVTGASVSDTDTIVLTISELLSESGGVASDFAISGVATNPSVSSIDIAGSTITLDLNGLITDADNPVISYTGTAAIEDLAKNPLADFANESVTNNLDTTRPTVTSFTTTSSNPTNSQTITYTVQFSESVTGFSAAGIDVTGTSGGTANEPTGAGRDYEFTVTRGISDGTVTVTIMEGAARDADDNLSFASTPVEITVDATPPTVTGAEVLNPNIIRLDLSEPISDNNAVASDFAIAGAASNPAVSSIAVSGSSIELSLTPSLTDADNPTVSYTRTTGGIEDPATNRLADFAGFTVTNDIDTTAPVPTLSTDIDSPTNLAVIPYMVEFTEAVSGFDGNGIDASIDGASLTASEPVTDDDTTYTFTVTHNVNEGELRVSIRAGAATDMDSNTSTASNTISHTIDRIAPTVTGASVSDTDTIILDISELLSESESVGVTSDFTISGVATNPSVASIVITGSTITLDLNSLITDADNPVISYTGTAGSIEDLAENPLAAFTDRAVENEIDTTGPVPTLTITSEPGAVTHTNSTTVSYMVTFDMDVTGFDEDDIEVEGSANNGNPEASNFVTVDGDEYTFDVERGDSDGNVIVFIPVDRAIDGSGNQNVASNRLEIIFDTISPTLMFASAESGDTRLRTIPFNVTFSEEVGGFDRNDIIIEGSATANTPTTSDDIFYEFDLVATSDGPVTVSIRENAARDMADNGNAESETIALTVDTERPTVEITSLTVDDLPTNLESISYTVAFNEQVNDFVAGDISASIDGSPLTASSPVPGADNTYTFDVTHGTNEGELVVSIPENVTTDNAGNNNTASNELVHTVDRIAPTVVSASVSDTDTITLEISESVSGGIAFDFAISGVNSGPEVDSIDVTGSTITLNLDDSITDADLPLLSYTGTTGSIEDPATNPLAAFTDRAVDNEIDTTRPAITSFGTESPDPTNSQTITYTVQFSETVTGFDATGIDVSGTSGGTAAEPTGSGTDYTFTVTRGISDGTVTVTILEGAARDADDNLSFASTPVEIVIDATPPTVTAAEVLNPNIIRLDISEPISDNGAIASDFAIAGAASNHVVSSLSASGSSVELSLAPPLTDADNPTVSYTRTAGGIEDAATNRLANFVSQAVTNNLDTTRPTVTSFTTTSSNPTNSQTIMYTVQFSEPVTRFNATGIDVTGTSGGTAAEPTGTGRDYEFVVTRGASDGTVTVTILEGAARDVDMNLSFASSTVEIVVDATPPTVTGADVVNPNIIRLDISEPVSDDNAVASNFAISGAASNPAVSSIAVSGSSIELSLSQSLTDADSPTVSYTRTAGGIEDAATNRLADFAGFTVTNDIDTTAPVPTLSTDIDSPTNLAVIPYMVVFTEEVSGFDRGDIDASINGASLTASRPASDDNITYTFTITHGASEGELRVSVRAGAATDMDSNTSTASNTISRMIDRIAPTVTGATASDTDTIILDISEPVSGGAASDFGVSGVASTPAVSSINIAGSTITLELNGLITDADNPTVSYTGTVDIEDAAENPLADFANQIVTNNLDTTRPIPTITITSEPGATHTNSPEVSYRVEFDMDVDGFIEQDIMVEGSANNGNPETSNFVTVDDATYTFDVARDNSDGNVIVSIPENRATDRSGNQNVASDRLEIIFDTISPTLMFASTESGDTKLRTIPFTVRFDEAVSGFDRNDIIIEGAATANTPTTSDDIFYEFDVVATSDGPVTVSIRENAARDMADNGNAASGMITLTVDTGRVRADLSTDVLSPTNLATIPYTVDFGEQISGFTAADIDASVDDTPVTASVPVAGAGDTYTFGVTHNVLEGEVTVSIMAGAVMDGAGNTNDASDQIALVVDRVAPTVTAASAPDTDTITLVISESVSGGAASDFTVTGVASTPAVSSIDITGSMITLNLDDSITDADNPAVSYMETGGIEDLAENRLAAFANRMVTNNLDTTPPVPAITSSTNSPTNSPEIQYTVDFVERVDGFDEGDIDASIGDVQLRASRPASDDGIEYTFVITHGATEGVVTVSIPENSVTDGEGNTNVASNIIMHTVDRVGPIPSVSTETSSPTNLATVQYNVTFNMPVTGFTVGDITVTGSADIVDASFVAVNSTHYTFDISRSSDGVARISVPAGVAIDGANNGNVASGVATIILDTTAPVARSGTLLNNGNIRLAMSERVFDNGTAASDFAVSGAASSPQVTSISVFRSAIELGLDGSITDDDAPTVSYNRTSGNVHDAATNSLGNFTGLEIGTADDGVDNTKWRTKATFGISYSHGEKLVDCGYSMDKLCRDVLDYHVDYQRQSIITNSTHDYTLKTYAQNGLRSLGIAFGVPSIGAPLSSAEAQIRVDLARDYNVQSTYLIENVEYINENNVIGQSATFEISRVKCLPTDERLDCVLLNINDVLFREQLYYEPFVISAMDSNRYATVHFMNDGILVYGDSMNEAPVHDLTTKLAHQRDLVQLTLTRTDKLSDVWTDQYGHTWTKNSFGTWSYVEIPKITVRPSCTDIDDRVCEAFGKKRDWHTANMEDMRDSLYGDIYTIPAFDSLTEVITLHDVDGDSRAAFLANSTYYLLD